MILTPPQKQVEQPKPRAQTHRHLTMYSPYGERRIGAITAMKARAPVLGGNFGVWGGLFSTFDCAVKGVRKKEDPWNAIIAGFFTVRYNTQEHGGQNIWKLSEL